MLVPSGFAANNGNRVRHSLMAMLRLDTTHRASVECRSMLAATIEELPDMPLAS